GALVRGIVPQRENEVAEFSEHMVMGQLDSLNDARWQIILGNELAMQLGVGIGDKVTVYAASIRSTPVGAMPRLKRFTVSGIFSMGMGDIDSGLALINMDDAQTLYQVDGPS